MEIKRERYLKKLIIRKHNEFIKVITGIRRCGESYLLNELFYVYLVNEGIDESHIIRFSFDSADDFKLINEDVIAMNEQKRKVDPRNFMDYISLKIKYDHYVYGGLSAVSLMLDEEQKLTI